MLDSQCCGIAGTYGFKSENYDTSQAIGEGLFDQINRLKPDLVITDCETCKWRDRDEHSVPLRTPHPPAGPGPGDPLATLEPDGPLGKEADKQTPDGKEPASAGAVDAG